MIFLYDAEPEHADQWRALLAAQLPDVAFVEGFEAVDPARVHYLLTWQPVADIERYTSLRIIFSAGAGVDQFDLSAIPESVALVRMVDESLADIMAEFVVLSALAIHRDLPAYREDQVQQVWSPRTILPASARRIGIMGLGQLGMACLAQLRHLRFQLLGWNRSVRKLDGVKSYTGPEELASFLSQCDILVNLLPLTDSTRGILNRETLAQLPKGAGLINVGRGEHVVETDLIVALDSGQIGAAILDVFQQEPMPEAHLLWSHPKVWVTPHIASTMQVDGGAEVVAQNILRDLDGRELLYTVDRQAGY
ncbi:2-hydroxyacid dehydrogenase [Pseudomonas aeruginosa]|uniref:2-hydroxyacid dehydrogenase n=1 Tax=Pseudomonas aeruginosa TaxID=287 RepID=UPI0003B9CF0D|nr:glyoxylate/hydroxypyruvate reductase A [Pseudomonas aeruginosa]KEA27602.1 2-hydroxyacid dehydrogenase [Pseudomonas aeruginosa C2773C]EJM8826846.1 glyoxylate/hydroxypyruvate reductase A [Pseudomonas aeruginosa]EKT8061469.1 glyoxylate/hydroxypyruvate reductase A [Pseudomonas aeruginosa]EKU7998597.1 glyoxylate/hydroxypyruvate reductase A [Pseudomonas aeruginosa]EKU8275016.1 glyoxylate/hydroxypyruvate reductase A [Pseudomonas aeruginosa]